MRLVRTLRGYRALAFIPGGMLLAKGYDLYAADLDCVRLKFLVTVPHSLLAHIAGWSRLLTRILRLGVRFGCRGADKRYLVAEKHRIWLLDLDSATLRLDHIVKTGSRPLAINAIEDVAGFDDADCYGEYWNNLEKDPVNIWIRKPGGAWQVAYTFPKGVIEHVHAVIPDSRRGLVWILTGDFGVSAGIWTAHDNFSSVIPVLSGEQEFRCCWLALRGQRMVYATDSPLQSNSVRELLLATLDENTQLAAPGARSEALMDIAGSSIYACMVEDQIVFSTSVEPGALSGNALRDWLDRTPGPGIRGNSADLVVGNEQTGFSIAGSWKKDFWPPRLFEFGSISFPSGTNPGNRIYAYFTALSEHDGALRIFELPRSDMPAVTNRVALPESMLPRAKD